MIDHPGAYMYHLVQPYCTMWYIKNEVTPRNTDRHVLVERCLGAFVAAGSLDLSMDRLAATAKVSKRMLIHYFGSKENLELSVLGLLEDQLRAQFSAQSLPSRISPRQAVLRLWERTSAPESRGALLLIMDIARRASHGSERSRQFYAQQLALWRALLSQYLSPGLVVDAVLQAFQGAVLEYLITGDRIAARNTLLRAVTEQRS